MSVSEIERAFATIPLLRRWRMTDFEIKTLAGYTNLNFRLCNEQHDWVLRIPRQRSNRFIDRDAEAHNQALAAGLGIAPLPDWRDYAGMSLTPTIADGDAVAAVEMTDATKLEEIVATIRKLHRSGVDFRGRVALEQLLERYFALLPPAQQERLQPRLQAARLLLATFEDRDYDYVPSHNDPVPGNLLRAPDRVWLIDWEFSAMASPCWDLATLCNSANLDFAQSRQVLRAYCAGAAPLEESLLFDYRNLLQLLEDCWMAVVAEGR